MSEEGAVIRGKWCPAPRRWFVFGQTESDCEIWDGESEVMIGLPLALVPEVEKARDRAVDAWLAWAAKQPREAG